MRVFVAMAAAALLLAGCYESEALLLDPAQAVTPLAVGTQTILDEGDTPEKVTVTLGQDHWYRVTSPDPREKPSRVLFTTLAGTRDGQIAFAYDDGGKYLYGIAERRDGRVFIDLPFCDLGAARDIAIAHGVKMAAKGALAPTCTFERAADLRAALIDWALRPGERPKLPNLPGAP